MPKSPHFQPDSLIRGHTPAPSFMHTHSQPKLDTAARAHHAHTKTNTFINASHVTLLEAVANTYMM